jgi:hypothetical protein
LGVSLVQGKETWSVPYSSFCFSGELIVVCPRFPHVPVFLTFSSLT